MHSPLDDSSMECEAAIRCDKYTCLVYLHNTGFSLPNRKMGSGECLEYLIKNSREELISDESDSDGDWEEADGFHDIW